MELAGKHVIVTGAGNGIGRACALAFAAEGPARLVVADLDSELAEAVAAEAGPAAVAATVDVGREAEIQRLIADAREASEPIDLFFSNAGVPGPPGGPEADDGELQLTWEVNVMAHVWAARALVPLDEGEEQHPGHRQPERGQFRRAENEVEHTNRGEENDDAGIAENPFEPIVPDLQAAISVTA